MSCLNMNSVIDELQSFLKINRHIVHKEHFAESMENIYFIKRFGKGYCSNSSKRFHYPSCPTNANNLSNELEEKSHTCACYEIRFRLRKIKKIVNFYKSILNE